MATGVDDVDLLLAAFPPGSVTGAPKLRALDVIAELEPQPRGMHCGAMGFASPVAGLELNVAIRTFELSPLPGDAYSVSLGVGVVGSRAGMAGVSAQGGAAGAAAVLRRSAGQRDQPVARGQCRCHA